MDLVSNPRRSHILVSIAGPGSNLLLAAASMLLLLGIGCSLGLFVPDAILTNFAILDLRATVKASGFPLASVVGPICTILRLSFFINVLLAFFNLIPIPPLDGSWVLEHLFPRKLGPLYERIRPFSILLFVALLYSGVLSYLLRPAIVVLRLGFDLLVSCTPF
jgi:Zn-dependent protease